MALGKQTDGPSTADTQDLGKYRENQDFVRSLLIGDMDFLPSLQELKETLSDQTKAAITKDLLHKLYQHHVERINPSADAFQEPHIKVDLHGLTDWSAQLLVHDVLQNMDQLLHEIVTGRGLHTAREEKKKTKRDVVAREIGQRNVELETSNELLHAVWQRDEGAVSLIRRPRCLDLYQDNILKFLPEANFWSECQAEAELPKYQEKYDEFWQQFKEFELRGRTKIVTSLRGRTMVQALSEQLSYLDQGIQNNMRKISPDQNRFVNASFIRTLRGKLDEQAQFVRGGLDLLKRGRDRINPKILAQLLWRHEKLITLLRSPDLVQEVHAVNSQANRNAQPQHEQRLQNPRSEGRTL